MQEEIIHVTADHLVGETARIKVEGYRFVTMSCVETGENRIEILYHFDKDLKLLHFLLQANKDTAVPSISPVWFSAFLAENEIQDLFGIHFNGLVLDYEGTFYLDEEVKTTPFCRYFVSGKSAKTEQNVIADGEAAMPDKTSSPVSEESAPGPEAAERS